MSEHDRIWLSPKCEENLPEGRTWCRSPQGACPDCGEDWIEFRRADTFAALEQRNAVLMGALNDLVDYLVVNEILPERSSRLCKVRAALLATGEEA